MEIKCFKLNKKIVKDLRNEIIVFLGFWNDIGH